jgi:hypothetical protein
MQFILSNKGIAIPRVFIPLGCIHTISMGQSSCYGTVLRVVTKTNLRHVQYIRETLKGSDDGIWHSVLLCLWTLDPVSETLCSSTFLEYRTMDKVQKPNSPEYIRFSIIFTTFRISGCYVYFWKKFPLALLLAYILSPGTSHKNKF